MPGYFFFEDLLSIDKGTVELRVHPTAARPRLPADTRISLDMNGNVNCLRIEDLPAEREQLVLACVEAATCADLLTSNSPLRYDENLCFGETD